MASSQTILDSLKTSVKAINPTIDTTKGPVYDLLLRPVPDEIAGPSQDVDDIKTLYSPLIATNPTNNAAIDTLGRAFRVPKPTGRRAQVSLVFWFTALPSQDITIPAGTAVATSDRGIIYTTTSDIQGINAQTAYSYYNTSTGRYEIASDAVATQDGQEYEVPAFRLSLLLSKVPGISGVYNPVPGTGGVSAGGYDTYIERIQKKFDGRDANSFASYELRCIELYPNVVINMIPSSDRIGFRRFVRGDGLDCIVAEPNVMVAEETFQAQNQTKFVLNHQPVIAVLDVFVNGNRITEYELVKTTNPSIADSAKSEDGVLISRKLKTSDTIRIRHSYCAYCYDLQYQLFNSNTDDFFGHDALVRLSSKTSIVVSLAIQAVSASSDFQTSVTTSVLSYINNLGFTRSLSSQDLIDYLYITYVEIRSITISEFRRTSNASSSIESIELAGYEIPELNSNNLQIRLVG